MSIVYEMLESTLRENIQMRTPDTFQIVEWKSRTLGSYVAEEDTAKVVVLEAVHSVANHFDLQLAGRELVILQGQITLATTPEGILSKMFEAMHGGKKCPPGTYANLEYRQDENGNTITEWICRPL
jgi:hypothetical protein